jgi:hypothetical protein
VRTAVLLTLSDEPAARVFDRVRTGSTLDPDAAIAAAKAAAAAQQARVRQQQDRLLDVLTQRPYDATLIYRLDRASNAIAIEVDGAWLPRLRRLPGVESTRIVETDVHRD